MKSQNQLVLSLEWTQPVLEVCTIIVVEHSVSENFEMKPSNEIVVRQEEDNSDEGDIGGRISETSLDQLTSSQLMSFRWCVSLLFRLCFHGSASGALG